MTELAFYQQSRPSEPDQRHTWTAEDGRDIAYFAAQCVGIVGLAVILYAVGPAVGLALIAATIAAWATIRRLAPAAPETTGNQADDARRGGRPLWQST